MCFTLVAQIVNDSHVVKVLACSTHIVSSAGDSFSLASMCSRPEQTGFCAGIPELDQEGWTTDDFVRDFPVDYSLLLENLTDPGVLC